MEEPLSATHPIGLLVLLVASAIVLALLVWATVTRGNKKEQREDILFRLGYTLTSPSPPQLVAQITRLHRRGDHQPAQLQSIYRRLIAGGEIYLFDLIDTGGSETNTRTADALTVVSSTLDLPRFALMPRPNYLPRSNDGGMLAKLADVALDAAAAQIGLMELDYPDDPEFAENFIVLAEDETATRAFLDNRLRTQLLQLERRYMIDAVANTFTLSHTFVGQPAPLSEERLQTESEDAERTLSLFRKGGMTYT